MLVYNGKKFIIVYACYTKYKKKELDVYLTLFLMYF